LLDGEVLVVARSDLDEFVRVAELDVLAALVRGLEALVALVVDEALAEPSLPPVAAGEPVEVVVATGGDEVAGGEAAAVEPVDDGEEPPHAAMISEIGRHKSSACARLTLPG
jgi:hypothetical protein